MQGEAKGFWQDSVLLHPMYSEDGALILVQSRGILTNADIGVAPEDFLVLPEVISC